MGSVRTVLLLGKPASGKGTQGKLLAEKLGWRYVATGDHLRSLAEREDHLGRQVRAALWSGAYLPSFFITALLVDSMLTLDSEMGVVLDGFGRTEEQAEEAHEIISVWNGRSYLAVNIQVSDEVAAERMRMRQKEVRRRDSDSEDKIRLRLELHTQKTFPANLFFETKQLLRGVDGEASIEEVHRSLCALLE